MRVSIDIDVFNALCNELPEGMTLREYINEILREKVFI